MAAKVEINEDELKKRLSPEAFKVTRRKGTERPFTNDDFPKKSGKFHCVCCGSVLFDAAHKFDSGTGWPSFYQPAEGAEVGEEDDRSWFMRRTEVVCSTCDAHLGHVFPDGPQPTGLRYCINGVALNFEAED